MSGPDYSDALCRALELVYSEVMDARRRALELVYGEVMEARGRYPSNTDLLLALTEELGEAMPGRKQAGDPEWLQVAGLAMRCYLEGAQGADEYFAANFAKLGGEARRILEAAGHKAPRKPEVPAAATQTVSIIIRIVAAKYGVSEAEICSSSREHRLTEARRLCFYLARQLTGEQWERLGQMFGGLHYSTVIKGADAVEANMTARQAAVRDLVYAKLKPGVDA